MQSKTTIAIVHVMALNYMCVIWDASVRHVEVDYVFHNEYYHPLPCIHGSHVVVILITGIYIYITFI